MKKPLLILLSVLLLTACSGKTEQGQTVTPPPLPQEESAPMPTPVFVSLRRADSRDELIRDLSERSERNFEQDFVSRGECRGDLTAYTGDIAYLLTDYSLEICRITPNGAVRLDSLQLGFFWKEEESEGIWQGSEKQCAALLLSGTRLAVLSDLFDYSIREADGAWISEDSSRCTVDIYDISSPAEPRWMRGFSQSGSLSTCLISEGRLLLVTDREIYSDDSFCDGTLPGYWQGEEWTALASEAVYLCDRGSSSYLQLGVYSLESAAEPECAALVGCGEQCLLCDRGLYGIIPEENGSAVYYLPIEGAAPGEPVCSYLEADYQSAAELTGAGSGLCLLQDGRLPLGEYQWERRYDEGRILALRAHESTAELCLLSGDSAHTLLASRPLGFDFLSASEAEEAVFADAELGLIGLPSEDGYSLFAYSEGEGFTHVLDCFSPGYFGNRRVHRSDDLLLITDMTRVFTVDLAARKLVGTLHF